MSARQIRRHGTQAALVPWRLLLSAFVLSSLLGLASSLAFTTGITVNATAVFDKNHAISVLAEVRPSSCQPVNGIKNLYTNTTIIGNTSTTGSNPVLFVGNTGGGTTVNAGAGADCSAPGAVSGAGAYLFNGSGGGDRCYNGPSGAGSYAYNNCVQMTYPYVSVSTATPTFT
jgi:hypothetical protein